MRCKYQDQIKMIANLVVTDCLQHPLLASLFVMDAVVLIFFHYWMPLLPALLLVGGLIYLSMLFGAKHASCFPQAQQD